MPLPHAADEPGWSALLRDDAALGAGVAAICVRHGLGAVPAKRYDSGSLPVYAIGNDHVLKLYPPHEETHSSIESRTLAAVQGALAIPTPRLLASGSADGWHYILMSQLHGRRLVDAWPEIPPLQRDRLADELGACIAALHALDTTTLTDFTPRWEPFLQAQRESAVQRQRERGLDSYWLERLPGFLQDWMPPGDQRRSLLHTELMREHLLVSPTASGWRWSGLFDFEPAMLGAPEYDFASFGLFVSCGDGRFLRRALLAYGYPPHALDAALQCRFMAYAILHRYSKLRWYLDRLPAPHAKTFEQLAARWWSFDDADAAGVHA